MCIQVSLLVEKTGCDAATLSAPSQLHGSEVGLLGEATLQSDPSIYLSFACEELLVCCIPSCPASTLTTPFRFQERLTLHTPQANTGKAMLPLQTLNTL